jgi:hypothetical protein
MVMNIAKVKLKDEEIPISLVGMGVTFLVHHDIVETVLASLKHFRTR